jgi:S1-C subfamily serine protease
VALLKIEGTFKPIEVGDSEPVRVGEFVVALANPLGKTPAATSGIVTSARASLRGWWLDNVIATDARLNPGYSGGPLIGVSGKMIGLNTAYVWQRGIAIPVNTLKLVIETLTREGRVKRGYLGIITRPMLLPREIATRADVNQSEALMVLTVEPGSPARNAGLAIGDIILRLGTEPIGSVYDLHKALGKDLIGRPSKLTILRGERILELSVTPGEAQD